MCPGLQRIKADAFDPFADLVRELPSCEALSGRDADLRYLVSHMPHSIIMVLSPWYASLVRQGISLGGLSSEPPFAIMAIATAQPSH